jgi:hypothetical protein
MCREVHCGLCGTEYDMGWIGGERYATCLAAQRGQQRCRFLLPSVPTAVLYTEPH